MIERTEYFVQVQADFPVRNILGDVHTYDNSKTDSDALATYIDFLKAGGKSLALVSGGQEYEILASFVGLIKSDHVYIPVDQHPAFERIEAILVVAEPSSIITVGDFLLEITHIPTIKFIELKTAFVQKSGYYPTHSARDDDSYYVVFTSDTTDQPEGV